MKRNSRSHRQRKSKSRLDDDWPIPDKPALIMELPPELLIEVFTQPILDTASLGSICLTCKRFYHLTSKVLYRRVRIPLLADGYPAHVLKALRKKNHSVLWAIEELMIFRLHSGWWVPRATPYNRIMSKVEDNTSNLLDSLKEGQLKKLSIQSEESSMVRNLKPTVILNRQPNLTHLSIPGCMMRNWHEPLPEPAFPALRTLLLHDIDTTKDLSKAWSLIENAQLTVKTLKLEVKSWNDLTRYIEKTYFDESWDIWEREDDKIRPLNAHLAALEHLHFSSIQNLQRFLTVMARSLYIPENIKTLRLGSCDTIGEYIRHTLPDMKNLTSLSVWFCTCTEHFLDLVDVLSNMPQLEALYVTFNTVLTESISFPSLCTRALQKRLKRLYFECIGERAAWPLIMPSDIRLIQNIREEKDMYGGIGEELEEWEVLEELAIQWAMEPWGPDVYPSTMPFLPESLKFFRFLAIDGKLDKDAEIKYDWIQKGQSENTNKEYYARAVKELIEFNMRWRDGKALNLEVVALRRLERSGYIRSLHVKERMDVLIYTVKYEKREEKVYPVIEEIGLDAFRRIYPGFKIMEVERHDNAWDREGRMWC